MNTEYTCDITWGSPYEFVDTDKKSSKKRKIEKDGADDINNVLIYKVGENEIHFAAGINKVTIELLIKEFSSVISNLYKSNDDDAEFTITYVVDSPGGSVTSVLKFIDFLNITKTKYKNIKFVSIISGLAASAGTVMSVVADKRYMTSNASAMIHELSSGNMGRYTQLVSYTKYLTKLHDSLVNAYLPKCKLTKSELEELLKNDTWYTPSEYLEHSFIDEIK
jgi:ATP-dependent protease ClpP protease subunit